MSADELTRRELLGTLGAAVSGLLLQPRTTRAEETTAAGGISATGRQGMVVSVSRAASEVGRAVLQQGGNAVDAAVATAFALAVTFPEAGNLGGGGFMLVSRPGQNPLAFDYRETAPAASTKTMFSRGESALGHKAVGVPGTVRGLALAHQRLGKLAWKDLVAPAVKLAADGFALDGDNADGLNRVLGKSADFAEFQRVYAGPKNRPWKTGDRLVQPDLAETLRLIAEQGPDEFYTGKTAARIVAEMRRGNGIITEEDLAGYQAKERLPVRGRYREFDIFGPPPPSSGGTCLVEMLNILEQFDLRKRDRFSAETLHLMAEAMRRAYCDRARYLADPDFVKIPPHLTDKDYARELAESISKLQATPSENLAPEIPIRNEGNSTTHFSVVDQEGWAVSNTYTLEESYGSRVVVRGGGFLLNNEMGDFNWLPGETDRSGRIGTEPNQIAPGKRMLSSMTPTIVQRDGRVVLVTGSPGGRTIINTVLCMLLNVLEFEMPLRQAVDAPRMHQQWFPDQISFEGTAKYSAAMERLQQLGHKIRNANKQGDAHTIGIDPATGAINGAADTRLSGWAAGY
jgi:gamma-glutamyltranspeptidase/glutathione hydrolase